MKTKLISLLLALAMVLCLAACGGTPAADNTPADTPTAPVDSQPTEPTETEEPETDIPTEEPTPAVHTHKYDNWASNGNGTHTKTCSATEGECDAASITEKCADDPCTECGYTIPHTHKYTYTSNGDGTHTAKCTGTTGKCDTKTYTENCSGDTCSKCGYTKSQNKDKNSEQGSGNSVTVPDHEETQGYLVWVPVNGGTKYHSKSGCSNMIDPIQVSIETAKSNGYTACKRCH